MKEPKLIDRFELGFLASETYRRNHIEGIYYQEFKCDKCGVRYLAKMKPIRPVFTELSKMSEQLTIKKFRCHRCSNAWIIIDDTEIIDIY